MRLGPGAELNTVGSSSGGSRFPVSRYGVYFGVAALGLTADLATKGWIFARLGMPGPDAETTAIVPPYLEWQTSLNEGALFGLGGGLQAVFALLSALALGFIVWWLFAAGNARSLPLTLALGGVSAGILGNLFDRLGLHGLTTADGRAIYAVRDWVHFQIPQWGFDWPNFNVADSLLVTGAAVLVVHAFLQPAPDKPAASA